jgi:hypothetical protein
VTQYIAARAVRVQVEKILKIGQRVNFAVGSDICPIWLQGPIKPKGQRAGSESSGHVGF